MALQIITGNIFTSRCQTLVNTVNCVGVMGAGLALECRLRFPEMHDKYVSLCDAQKIDIGTLWIYKAPERWVLNFPTKKHWKYPSKPEFLHAGMQKFVGTYAEKGVHSIAFPLLGSDKGGIPQEESLNIMAGYLKDLDLDVEIYRYDPSAKDDLYEKTKKWLLAQNPEGITEATKLRSDYVAKVLDALQSPKIVQLNQLARVPGIGIKTLEKIFNVARISFGKDCPDTPRQKSLL